MGSVVNGKKSLFLMAGSQPGTVKALDWDWCQDETMDFIQGITVPGGVVMSPIEVTASPLSVKQLQESYYTNRGKFSIRRGPASFDEDRLGSPIQYDLPPGGFPHPVSLVSPPIVLQTRSLRTDKCAYALGVEYNKKIWDDVRIKTCAPPYECPAEILTNSTSLVTCSVDDASPAVFFGKQFKSWDGLNQFSEFLQSIADSPVLVRAGEPQYTSAFIDSQTKQITIIMIAYSLQYGIASSISIVGKFSTVVSVDFNVKHLLSVEGKDLEDYRVVAISAFVLAAIILLEKFLTLRRSRK